MAKMLPSFTRDCRLVEDVWADGAKDPAEIHKQDPGVCPWVDEVL